MNLPRSRIDAMSIINRTDYVSNEIKRLKKRANLLTRDPEKATRQAASLCKSCYYAGSKIGGQAMSSRQCAFCDNVLRASSTAVDVICLDCAKRRMLCKQCGADVDLINRKNRPE